MTNTAQFGPTIAIAAASSVARAFLIGAAGYVAVRYRPRKGLDDPIIPPKFVGALARTNYLLLLCPLFYSAIGKAVNPSVLAGLWCVIVGFFFVIFAGVASATALSFLPGFRFLRRKSDRNAFESFRIAASIPNAVSLPLLLFPGLCEYGVIHEAFSSDPESSTEAMIQECTDGANVMIFLCQFAFCLYLFSFGQKVLLGPSISIQTLDETHKLSPTDRRMILKEAIAGSMAKIEIARDENENLGIEEDKSIELVHGASHSHTETKEADKSSSSLSTSSYFTRERFSTLLKRIAEWAKESFGSAGSIAMILGIITGCIPWLPSALFVPGGSLRFLGGALDSLGQAATPVSLLVVGASLFDEPGATETADEENTESTMGDDQHRPKEKAPQRRGCVSEEVMTHIWFNLSRLVFAPALVFAALIGLDCGVPGLFGDDADGDAGFQIPHLFKTIMLVGSAAPSAMTVIVVLKAAAGNSSGTNDPSGEHASYMARRIAKLYLPSYVISTITVAVWSMAGLWISLPDEEGRYFCEPRVA